MRAIYVLNLGRSPLLSACAVSLAAIVLALSTAAPASAYIIAIKLKSTKVGSWFLPGVQVPVNHYSTTFCYYIGPGEGAPDWVDSSRAVIVGDPTSPGPSDLTTTEVLFSAGPGASAALADLGTSLLFDDTMFPVPAGLSSSTMGSTEFRLTPTAPPPLAPGVSEINYPGLFVSSTLSLFDPELIVAQATMSNGIIVSGEIARVPEPSAVVLAALALGAVALGPVRRERRR